MITKSVQRLEGVKDQIDSAIRVYFLRDDLVSALTLAGAAERVLSDLQPQDGIFGVDAHSIRSMINLYIKAEHQKEAAALFRKDYDFFRHADRSGVRDYEVKEVSVLFLIFLSLCSFEFLGQKKTVEMRAFFWWFFASHPHYLKQDAPVKASVLKVRQILGEISKREYFQAFITASDGDLLFNLEAEKRTSQPRMVVRVS
jgi:hypothetical protein